MTVKNFINNLFSRACIYFTCIMVVYIAIAALVNVGESALLLEAGRTILFFVFSLLLALANGIFLFERLSGAVKILLHYLIVLFAFYSCFMLTLKVRTSTVLIGLIAFTIVYFAAVGIIAAFKARYRSNLERSEAYNKQYTHKK